MNLGEFDDDVRAISLQEKSYLVTENSVTKILKSLVTGINPSLKMVSLNFSDEYGDGKI